MHIVQYAKLISFYSYLFRVLFMRVLFVSIAVCLTLLLSACSDDVALERQYLTGPTMGSEYHITLMATKEVDINALHQGIKDRLLKVNAIASTYIQDSELSRLNSYFASELEYPVSVAVSASLNEILQAAQQVFKQSKGTFDISVGPLVNRWGFGPEDKRGIPSHEEIKQLKADTGQAALTLNKNMLTLSAKRKLDLSAIAKGWGVDVIARYLDEQHISSYLVDIGGEVRAQGKKPNQQSWRIAIERPASRINAKQQAQFVVNLDNQAMATSGDYRNYFESQGKRYSHTINPTTGYPINHGLASVSVLYQNCMLADAYATAINVMGVEKGLEFAKKHNLAVYLIERKGDQFVEHYSPLFKQKFISK